MRVNVSYVLRRDQVQAVAAYVAPPLKIEFSGEENAWDVGKD